MLADVSFVEPDIDGPQRQHPATRHGIAGVDRKIHDDLLNLAGIGLDRTQLRIKHRYQFHVFAEKAEKKFFHLLDQGIDVQHPGGEHLAAAEGQ